MKKCTEENVRAFLLIKYCGALAERGLNQERIPDDCDLFKEGIIDSLGVLEMINDVEREFGVQLDMERLDAEVLTVLGSFCRYVATNWRGASP